MKRDYTLGLLILILISVLRPDNSLGQQSYPYKFNYLTVDEGLSHTDANDITQDAQGYIWVATYFGLSRYDGYSVKRYYNNNTPLSSAFKNRLRCLYPDGAGKIWLSSEAGIQCFDARLETYMDYNESGGKPNTYEKIYKPAGNILYGLTSGGQFNRLAITGNSLTELPLNIPSDTRFSGMVSDKSGRLFLSGNKGLWELCDGGVFKKVPVAGLPDSNLNSVSIDNEDNLLVTIRSRLFLLSPAIGQQGTDKTEGLGLSVAKRFICPTGEDIKSVAEEGQSDYWINTSADLYRLDKNFGLVQIVNDRSSMRSLNSSSTTKVFIDRSECLWVCTFGGGVNFCDLHEKLFYTFQHNPAVTNSLSGNHIRSVMADGDDLWIGTTANGLNLYNLKTRTFAYYDADHSPVRLKNNVIQSLLTDNDRNLWIGTGAGIEILRPDRKTLWQPPGYAQFPTSPVETLAKDCYGNIWFGNHVNKFGVIWKDDKKNYHVKYYGESYFILADEKVPQLFTSSTQGLKRLIIDREGNIIRTYSYYAAANSHSLSSNYTYPICKQNDSVYWIGTIGGGVDRLSLAVNDSFTIRSYTGKDGVFTDVESMEIDKAGNVWMGGNGLECLNPVTGKLIRFDKNDGLQGNSFKVGSSYAGADGRLYFGGINGLNYFYPDQIRSNPISARPVLTDILINNQKPYYGNPDSSGNRGNTIKQSIGYGSDLRLNHLQNNFVIFFSSMHFANPLKCRYRYKLIGFDKEWKYTDGQNPRAAYSNLDYDHYTFVVEATNNDGIWSDHRAGTSIIIIPPWWKSRIAKAMYVLLILSVLLGIYIYQARWYRLKRELEIRAINEKKREEIHQQREEIHQQREELYQQQLTFFTNVSHEFRTPLTLILGPLESLISQNNDTSLNAAFQLMFRNAKRLINLIGELMNFKKLADNVIKLHVQPLLIDHFCKDLAWEFQNLAESKGIAFTITDYTEAVSLGRGGLTGWFDVQILEKILFNLLNNSFKYTDRGGRISFNLFFDVDQLKSSFSNGFQVIYEGPRAKKYIYFHIADSGIGISPESLTKIFERYYRVNTNHLGSGIGLALVKSLTQLHKGDIYVYSERNKGTEIIIGIPWGEESYDASEKTAPSGASLETQLEFSDNYLLLPQPDSNESGDAGTGDPANGPADPGRTKARKHILLVDDNQELRAFLRQTLEKQYQIYEAGNGLTALEIASDKIPDLIISDVMMPGMSGIELCRLIKERFETRHIPFVILSAKDALDTKIEGLGSGADYYFAKPLSIDLLLLTIYNIFEQGEKQKQRYTNNYLSEATELVHSEKDKEFFNALVKLIEDNIQEPGLDVEFLCGRLHISRTKLYQKIQSISDQSVAEFIRTIRLKKAIYLMTHEILSMNEVAERIGLNSASNFSRAFKKEYGKSPLHFMQDLRKD